MKRKKVPAWLVFTRKERNVALWIAVCILVIRLYPLLKNSWGSQKEVWSPPAFFDTWFASDTFSASPFSPFDPDSADAERPYTFDRTDLRTAQTHRLSQAHFFSPDTALVSDWENTGIPRDLAFRITKYIRAGAEIHTADDLMRVYGMDSILLAQIKPWMVLPEKGNELSINSPEEDFGEPEVVQLEQCSIASLRALGFSSYEAKRISDFVSSAGGLYSIDQLYGLYGIDSIHLHTVESYLLFDPAAIKLLHLNSTGFDKLAAHPYLSDKLAREIISYREKTGKFYAVSEVMKVQGMSKYLYEKLKPYLAL